MVKKGEKCYLGRTANVGFYEVAFILGLRLPLTELHGWLADYLGVSVCQIAPNTWRIFLGVEVLWGQMSGGCRSLPLMNSFIATNPTN